jgi:hypothetical protein
MCKKNGQSNLNYFGYKNLIGRGGRMFKHFIGEIYLLERPPADEAVQFIIYKPLNCIPIIFLKKPLSFQFVIGFCS